MFVKGISECIVKRIDGCIVKGIAEWVGVGCTGDIKMSIMSRDGCGDREPIKLHGIEYSIDSIIKSINMSKSRPNFPIITLNHTNNTP